jgi:dihydrofolate reductase
MSPAHKNISIIVAIAENYAIGRNNDLLTHIPDDLKRFKQLTTGHTIVMGKKTYESLPNRPLPNRRSLVITDLPSEKIAGCEMAYSISDAVEKMEADKENFVIGGGSIYRQFLPLANKLYITWVHMRFDADVFFPEIDLTEWNLDEEVTIEAGLKTSFGYSYCTYSKK